MATGFNKGSLTVDNQSTSRTNLGLGSLATLNSVNNSNWSGTQLAVTNGGTGLTGTTANQLLYSSATNTIAGLASGNNGVVITDGSGVPSISSTLPSAVQGNITALGTIANGLTLGSATINTTGTGSFIQKKVSGNTALTVTVTWANSHSSGDSYIFLKLLRTASDVSANSRSVEQPCAIYTINSGPTITIGTDNTDLPLGSGITINACTLSATTATSATIQSTVAAGATMHSFAVEVLTTPNRIGSVTLS
jgi:hypothetical protein